MNIKINLILLFITAAGISCIGSLINFDKDTRYEIKYHMIVIKHHFENIRSNLNQKPPLVEAEGNLAGIEKIDEALQSLESFSENQNMEVFRDNLGKSREILSFLKDSVETEKTDRVMYNFKRLNNQCIVCHTRYRVGIHL